MSFKRVTLWSSSLLVMESICFLTVSYFCRNFARGFIFPNKRAKNPGFLFGSNSSTSKPRIVATISFKAAPEPPKSLFLTPSSILSEISVTLSCAFEPKNMMELLSFILISAINLSISCFSLSSA